MTTATTRRTRLLLGLAAAVLAGGLTACSGDQASEVSEEDARSYYEDYEPQEGDGAGGAVNYSTTSPDAEPRGPGLLEHNTFVDAGTSGFVDTARDQTSTFAFDVDTGSWGVARTLLRQGQLPPPESVRVEEWVNAQEYDDPAPTDAALAVSAASAERGDGSQVARIAVAAADAELDDLPPLHVTLAVDRSGSMDIRERLGLVQTSMALMAQGLRPDDTVAVVGFDDEVETVLEPTAVRDAEQIIEAIDGLEPGGSTNLEGGLAQGYDLARSTFDPEAINVVVLCSDGVANVGATGPDSIVNRIAEEGADGIHLVTAGFGMGNFNDHLMEQLADRGDGFYAYVDTPDEARELFVEDLASTLAPVATEAKSQVRFDPELVTSWRQVGFENRQLSDADFDDARADAGEIGAGHRVSAVYDVQLAEGVEPGAQIGTATVRWTPPGGGQGREVTTPILAADPGAPADADLELSVLTADTALAIKQGADVGRLAELADRARALGAPAEELLALIEQARGAADQGS